MTSSNSHWVVGTCPSFTPLQSHWLLRPGALTEALRAEGEVTLRVLCERADELSAQEGELLGAPAGSPIWLREVVMAVKGVDSVFARSFALLSDTEAQGAWAGLRRLESRPLADMLYDDPAISRSPFRIARLVPEDPAYESLRRALPERCLLAHALLSRYSVFSRAACPLLVMECFLPRFWETVSDRLPHAGWGGRCGEDDEGRTGHDEPAA